MILLSIDPGSAHCAWAIWELQPDRITEGTRWKCIYAAELGPEEFLDNAKRWISGREFAQVAIEAFFLQSDKALAQIGSSFGTVEVIGVVRHLCRWNSVPFETVTSSARDAAFIKMKTVKYKFPKDRAGHMKSAICVGAVATGWRATNHRVGDGCG